MNNKTSLALGVDVGGTNTKVGLVSSKGKILHSQSFPTNALGSNPDPFLTNLKNVLQTFIKSTDKTILGIGASFHGYIDDENTGLVVCENTPALRGFNFMEFFSRSFKFPVKILNDVSAHSLAEYTFGSGRNESRFMTVAVGTGIGAGVIINGKPLRFLGGTIGDAGRIILKPGGPKSVYAVSGSAEALCGTKNIERLAEQKYGEQKPAFDIIHSARKGNDPIAIEIIQEIGMYLGWTIASLSTIFLPSKIALTGGTTEAGQVLLDACRRQFDELVGEYYQKMTFLSNGKFKPATIVIGEYRGESGMVGAVIDFFNNSKSIDKVKSII